MTTTYRVEVRDYRTDVWSPTDAEFPTRAAAAAYLRANFQAYPGADGLAIHRVVEVPFSSLRDFKRTRRFTITLFDDIVSGNSPAPHCLAARPVRCNCCGRYTVLPLDDATVAKQPDGTTFVCHPSIGGCNLGYEFVGSPEEFAEVRA